MANRPTVPPDPKPARVLRERLAECRRRGLPFDEAWRESTAVALRSAGDWQPTFQWSRPTWRRAYERREPRRGERLRITPSDLTAA